MWPREVERFTAMSQKNDIISYNNYRFFKNNNNIGVITSIGVSVTIMMNE